jgi:RNA polymerase sigma-70 factor (ECF subfamily)
MTQRSAHQLRSLPAGDASPGDREPAAPAAPAAGPPAQPGEHDADAIVDRLYRENGAFVLSYVTGLLKDRYLAEDVVQETMLRAWRHCGEFRPEKGSVRGWLIRVAHNVAMDTIRMRRSRPAEVAEDAAPEAPVADHADAVVTALHVRRALDRLSPSHRAVIEEIYLNGRTAREAAVRLGIPEGTVFSRSYYALRVLRQEMGVTLPAASAAAA